VPLRSEPLFRVAAPDRPGVTVGLLLRNLLAEGGDDTLYFERLEVVNAVDGSVRRWSMRVSMWDTEDAKFRRVLLWLHPWRERSEPRLPEDARAAHQDDRFTRLALDRRVFDHVPVCVVDASLRVQLASPGFEELVGESFDPDAPGDRHVFAVFPPLRTDSLRVLLDAARKGLASTGTVQLSIPTSHGDLRHVEVEVRTLAPRDERASELLLLLHEVDGMASSASATDRQQANVPVPDTVDAIASNLSGWPPPLNEHVLVVEPDSWGRMLWTDTLRQAGVAEVAVCDAAREVWTRHDPARFGAILVGLDGDATAVSTLCRRLAEEAPNVPILGLTDRLADEARLVTGDTRLAGILAGPGKEARLRELVPVLFRWDDRRGPAAAPPDVPPSAGPSGTDVPGAPQGETGPDDAPAAGPEPDAPAGPEATLPLAADEVAGETPSAAAEGTTASVPELDLFGTDALSERLGNGAATLELVFLGASEPDMQQLRMLYRTERLHIGLVYDPDPHAFGLPLARNLGIHTATGPGAPALERRPDAVVLARPELERHLADLGLEDCPRVTRNEIELFLADPDAFLAAEDFRFGERIFGDIGAAADTDVTGPPLDPAHTGSDEPAATVPAPALADEPEPTPPVAAEAPSATPAAAAAPVPVAAPAAPSRPAGTAIERRPALHSGDVSREVGQLLDALDLLLDFRRLSERVLAMAIEIAHGKTGSLMMLNDDRTELRIVAAVGLPPRIIEKTRQRIGDGIGGRVAEQGEGLLLHGTIHDERTGSGAERRELRSAVCVPVFAEGQVIGVLSVNSDPADESFDNTALRDVAQLGTSVGAALDRSRQLRRMRGRSFELSVRAEIEQLVSGSDDILSRLSRVAARVAQMLNLDTCEIWLYDPESRALSLRAVSGLSVASMDAVTVPVGSGHVGWVAKNLRPLVLRSQSDEFGEPDAPRLTSVGVPVRYQTELVGVMTVESSSATPLDEERVALIASVASVIGDRIGRSRAFQDSERRVTLLSALSELGLAFSSATERVGLAKLVTFTASTLLESEVATIRLPREGAAASPGDPTGYERVSAHGAAVTDEDPLADLENFIAREVAHRGRPCAKAELASPDLDRLLQRSNVAAFLGIPCWSGNTMVGVVSVFRVVDPDGRNREYGTPELEVAERLGDYTAAAARRFVPGVSGEDD